MARQIEIRTGLRKNNKTNLGQTNRNLLSSSESAKQDMLYTELGTCILLQSNVVASRDYKLHGEGERATAIDFMLRRAITIR